MEVNKTTFAGQQSQPVRGNQSAKFNSEVSERSPLADRKENAARIRRQLKENAAAYPMEYYGF